MATTLTQQLTHSNEYGANSSMARQAIINGNFDVWQRGTTVTNPASGAFLADRFKIQIAADGGTPPTNIIHSRQLLTSGDIPNAFYHYRIAPDGAGATYGVNSNYMVKQLIEHGVRNLCGLNKKITVSFYARSSITNKRIGLSVWQYYGTTGSPSAEEYLLGDVFTLTSSWVKYTYTFTTNTLVGKTFGTDNNDSLIVNFWTQWGTSYGGSYLKGSVTAESFVGSGTIDIAQVQLCAGDTALPYMPKSFNQELLDCQRYYEKSYDYTVVPATTDTLGETAYAYNTGTTYKILTPRYLVPKRATVTPTYYDDAGNASRITTLDSGLSATDNVTATGLDKQNKLGFRIYHLTAAFGIRFHWVADAEL